MAKFAEAPRFILDEYFGEYSTGSVDTEAPPILIGPRTTFVADSYAGRNIELLVERTVNDIRELLKIPFTIPDTYYSDNFFYLYRDTESETAATSGAVIDEGSNVYFQKDGTFHTFVQQTPAYKNFVNTNKVLLYAGQLNSTNTTNLYKLEYRGIDRWALSAIPEHQRTEKIEELFRLFFDKIYNEAYNLERNVITLRDAYEINLDFITYLASHYSYDIDIELEEQVQRELVWNFINLLKRKGTYASLYIIFKTFFPLTENSLHVYERWHKRRLTEPPLKYFVDIHYLHTYGVAPSGCAAPGYYILPSSTVIPIPTEDSHVYFQTSPSAKWLIPHKLETQALIAQFFDNTYNKMLPTSLYFPQDDLIVAEFNIASRGLALIQEADTTYTAGTSAAWYFEHNLNQITPVVQHYEDTSNYTVFLPQDVGPQDPNKLLVQTYIDTEGSISLAISGDYVHNQTDRAATWTISHNLSAAGVLSDFYISYPQKTWVVPNTANTLFMIVQCFDTDYKVIEPKYVTIIDEDTLYISFEKEVSGYIYYLEPHITIDMGADSTWNIEHWLSSQYNINAFWSFNRTTIATQGYGTIYDDVMEESRIYEQDVGEIVYDEYYNRMEEIILQHVYPITDDTITATSHQVLDNIKFLGYIPDYVHNQVEESTSWYITHNLNQFAVVSNFYTHASLATWSLITSGSVGISGSNFLYQCYDSEGYLLVPTSTAITESGFDLYFSSAKAGFVNIANADYVLEVPALSASWGIEWDFGENYPVITRNALAQFRPDGSVIPTLVELDDINRDSLTATFSTPTSGKALVAHGEFIWLQDIAASTWYVDHWLETEDVIVQPYRIMPDNSVRALTLGSGLTDIRIYNSDKIWLTFDGDYLGFVIIKLADVSYMPMEKSTPKSIELLDGNHLIATFHSNAKGKASIARASGILRSVKKVLPKKVWLADENTTKANFYTPQDGYGVVRYVSTLPYIPTDDDGEGMMMSPHYKAEIDLNCQPFGENYILNEKLATELVKTWDISKPASKFSHYHWLISPYTDWSGNWYEVYDADQYEVNIFTRFVRNIGEIDDDETPKVARFMVTTSSSTGTNYIVDATHDLNSTDILVQCYRRLDSSLVYPISIQILDASTVRLIFSESFVGAILFALADYTDTESVEASGAWHGGPWMSVHDLNTRWIIAQIYDRMIKQTSPSGHILYDTDTIKHDFDVPFLGHMHALSGGYYFYQEFASEEWTVTHGFEHDGVFIQCFDTEFNELLPENIVLYDGYCEITFDVAVAGYVILREVGGLDTVDSIIDSLTTYGGYFKIGNGTTGKGWDARNHNDLESPIATSNMVTATSDSVYDYIKAQMLTIHTQLPTNVSELGLFDVTNRLLFYTVINSELFKPGNVNITAHYRIHKTDLT